jgi:hypothetical protein
MNCTIKIYYVLSNQKIQTNQNKNNKNQTKTNKKLKIKTKEIIITGTLINLSSKIKLEKLLILDISITKIKSMLN